MIERVVEPSRIRRGRMATSPVWYVTRGSERVRFHRKWQAVAFDAAGCDHEKTVGGFCFACCGIVETVAPPKESKCP